MSKINRDFEIFGFDINYERANDVSKKYNIKILLNQHKIYSEDFNFFIISTSPESHHIYIDIALNSKTPAFVEASVLDINFNLFIKKTKDLKASILPSCTLLFHPAIIFIKSLIQKNELGKVLNASYNSGQYLPDWHIYENVKDFYVSKKETGGARELFHLS